MQNASEQKNNRGYFFRFAPHEWIEWLSSSDEEAGKRFKEMLVRLSKNSAPDGSIELAMIKEVEAYRERQRQNILKRWNKDQPQEPPPNPQPSIPPTRTQPPMAQQRRQTQPRPTKEQIYDICDATDIPIAVAMEWFDYMESKDWNGIKTTWQSALQGFWKMKQRI